MSWSWIHACVQRTGFLTRLTWINHRWKARQSNLLWLFTKWYIDIHHWNRKWVLHRCSCSLDEQFLNSYLGHDAPIYQVQWSPHLNQIFISAAADWTVKLWHEKVFSQFLSSEPMRNMLLMFAGANQLHSVCLRLLNGTLQVWDIERSTWSQNGPNLLLKHHGLSFAKFI